MIVMTGEFFKVKCEKCKNEQVIFGKPAEDVKCLVCGETLAFATGGKAKMTAKVSGTVE